MLSNLSIRDVVLIEKLDLTLGSGLNVLTGETGAGKSILLDSLGLALGSRADRGLIRDGAKQATVTACFDIDQDNQPLTALMDAYGYDITDGQIIIRRLISQDGRSKAWINDQPASQNLVAKLGPYLVEVHGQHDDRGLLDPASHRRVLDMFLDDADLLADVAAAHAKVSDLTDRLAEEQENLLTAQQDEEYLRHSLEELEALSPEEGEERSLADRRAVMMQGEKLTGELGSFLDDLAGRKGIEPALRGVLRRMERIDERAKAYLEDAMQSLDRASLELSEAVTTLEALNRDVTFDVGELEQVEERLFELRRLARKHDCACDALPELRVSLEQQLGSIEAGDTLVSDLKRELVKAEADFQAAVEALHKAREAAAGRFDDRIMAELPPLKLEKAAFQTVVEPLDRAQWGAFGGDKVYFQVRTNPGSRFGPLTKVASGGEFARIILALKVVLAKKSNVPTMVFDEVDQGVGGATADAVGERLGRLSVDAQILVVTHSPQVAARGDTHFRIEKNDTNNITRTSVRALADQERREELARMLAGAEISDEARAAADTLLKASSI